MRPRRQSVSPGPQTKRAPSQARAEGTHGGSQDQDRDTQLQQVAEEGRDGSESHGARGAPRQKQQLRQAAQVDEREPSHATERQAPPPLPVPGEPPGSERRDGVGNQV